MTLTHLQPILADSISRISEDLGSLLDDPALIGSLGQPLEELLGLNLGIPMDFSLVPVDVAIALFGG